MADLGLFFGGDLSVGPTGDLALADGSALTQQRLLRRLLTNAGDYIWQLTYGAGLGQFVGSPNASAEIYAVTRAQMLLESSVAHSPAPAIYSETLASGNVTLTIRYADSASGISDVLAFSV